jgi:hypothetical protein
MKAMPSPRHRRSSSGSLPAWGINLIIGVLAAILLGFLILSGLLADGCRLIGQLAIGVIPAVIALAILFGLYFMPFIIAIKSPRAAAIFVANLVFGWTIVGWFVVLIWALAESGSMNKTTH